jgi:hypothetical protein
VKTFDVPLFAQLVSGRVGQGRDIKDCEEIWMAASFFDSLSVQERQLAQDRTDALSAMLVRWAARYPTVRTARVFSVALLTSTAAPSLCPINTFVSARLILWIFGVDDLVDQRVVSLAELDWQMQNWYRIAGGDVVRGDEQDELGRMLIEIKRDLHMYPLFESLHEHWAAELRRLLEGLAAGYRMAIAYAAHGPSALPSLEKYVQLGLHSIGVPLWSWAVWAVIDDPSIQEYLGPIVRATEHAAAAVRLYNDLRTYQRELNEGNINSVLITYHAMWDGDPGQPVERVVTEAKQHIMQLAVSYGHMCKDILDDVHTESGVPEAVLLRTVALRPEQA